jgi:hypothetical protein
MLDILATGDPDEFMKDETKTYINSLLYRIQGLTGCKSVGRFTGFATCGWTKDDPTIKTWVPIWAGSVWYDGKQALKWLPKSGGSEDKTVTPTRGHTYRGLVDRCA